MKQRAILLIFVMLAAIGAVLVIEFSPAVASSHREAPAILSTPQVDGTDFYMFRSYEDGRDGFVTLIADYNPLQDPYGGPNYFPLDPDAVYDIHINNNGADNPAGQITEDITYRFLVFQDLEPFSLSIGDENVAAPLVNAGSFGATQGEGALTETRNYTVQVILGDINDPTSVNFVTDATTGATRFGMPFDNIGNKSIPDYEAYTSSFIHEVTIPGCEPGGRVFVGQRREPFAVNLGEIFDLFNITNLLGNPDAERSDTADKNITSFVLEVPIGCLTGDGGPVIGGWTTASLPRNRTLTESPTFGEPDQQSGDLVQVSRLGNPLVNELVIGLPDKNLFNAAHPRDDGANFLSYVTNPTLPALVETLFGVTAPTNIPRNDLVKTFLTGLLGVNADRSVGEIQRLNTNISPTPVGEQSNLGLLGGDFAGYPNGRRPGDDVVDITLRVAMGALCHLPDPNAPTGGDDEYTATLLGSNVVPPVNTTRTGDCVGGLLGGNLLQIVCTHNVPNVIRGSLRQGAAGQEGPEICRDAFGPLPVGFDCFLTPAELDALLDGDTYIELNTISNPNGEVRGQVNPPPPPSLGMCNPEDAPSGVLDLTDGAYQGPYQFEDTFPYVTTPIPGSPSEARPRTANLIDDNLELVEPFEPTDASGFCEMQQILAGFRFGCNFNVTNPLAVKITKDGPNGETLWFFDLVSDPPASPGILEKVLDETNFMGSDLEIFADGFESGDVTAWSTVEGNPTKIGGPFR